MFKFNLNRLICLLVPAALRKAKFLAWLNASMSYLWMTLEDLRQFRDATIKEAKMTPQIAYLEKLLNDRYGTGTEIFISDGYTLGPWIFSDTEAADPEFFMDQANSFVYSIYVFATVNFVVNIPGSIDDFVQQIAAMVAKYKLAGKSFIIQIF